LQNFAKVINNYKELANKQQDLLDQNTKLKNEQSFSQLIKSEEEINRFVKESNKMYGKILYSTKGSIEFLTNLRVLENSFSTFIENSLKSQEKLLNAQKEFADEQLKIQQEQENAFDEITKSTSAVNQKVDTLIDKERDIINDQVISQKVLINVIETESASFVRSKKILDELLEYSKATLEELEAIKTNAEKFEATISTFLTELQRTENSILVQYFNLKVVSFYIIACAIAILATCTFNFLFVLYLFNYYFSK